METGPNLLPVLIDILIRFRRWPYALTSDITKAFLQVCVKEEDQDVHRFLWRKDKAIRVMRFDRVPFGNRSSPFLLNATIKHHLASSTPSRVVNELNENLYVDDWLSGADTETELDELKHGAIEVMNKAGMPLAKWSSNVNLNSNEKNCKDIDLKGPEDPGSASSKVLGLKWLTVLDCFTFEGIDVTYSVKITKRVILSLMARLFDPLGFLGPYSMLVKILFQELWKLKLDWDETIPVDLENQFSNWISGLSVVHSWRVQRCFVVHSWENLKAMQVHVFCDASERAYGACVYLKVWEGDDSPLISLVLAKGKVAPMKTISIPRLELLAALIGARLLSQVRRALRLSEDVDYYCWSDSQVVLHWIQNEPWRWKTFVGNRVSEIQRLTSAKRWFHCPGKDNPSDLLSRGMHAEDLISSRMWLKGPTWLELNVLPLDTGKSDEYFLDDVLSEAKGPAEEASLLTTQCDGDSAVFIDVGRYSSFTKAIRVFAWVLRFITNTKLEEKTLGDLSFDELSAAKVQLLKRSQEEAFCDEIKSLRAGKLVSKRSFIAKLSPFLGSDGLLRMRGRLHFSQLTLDEKFPIIIPKGDLATLIVRYQHKLLKHAGVSLMISSLRNSFWILGVRKIAKKVKRECVPCQRMDKGLGEQNVAPLPRDRVTQAPPFSVTGIDHAGPLYCADHGKKKFYILLFSCALVRAVHLELVESLSLTDFICAFRRFVARRGLPNTIYSDFAKTFQAGKIQLLKLFPNQCPKWKFIAPRSPWWGGFWERLVRTVKSGLKKSVGSLSLTKTELETCLHEVEACVNSRPLTFVGDDVDSQTPLTPSHFLLCRSSAWENSDDRDPVSSPDLLLSLDIARSTLLERFWAIWMKDYLRNLRQVSTRKNAENFQIGSIVLMRVEGCPRLSWPLGIVRKVFPGRDGLIRAVELETASGKFCRSVQTLVLLELGDKPEDLVGIEDVQSQVCFDTNSNNTISQTTYDQTKSQCDTTNTEIPVVVTRSGRRSKPVHRLDL